MSDLLDVAKEQKKAGEGQLEQSRREVTKLEASYKSLSREFAKVQLTLCLVRISFLDILFELINTPNRYQVCQSYLEIR